MHQASSKSPRQSHKVLLNESRIVINLHEYFTGSRRAGEDPGLT
uniref:Uncharacterized protein n=1 Tax=Setaria italica TaxID=4555 RepID=K4AP43_SETIT